MAASVRLQSLDQDKNISFLLKELDTLREINNKVRMHTGEAATSGHAPLSCFSLKST